MLAFFMVEMINGEIELLRINIEVLWNRHKKGMNQQPSAENKGKSAELVAFGFHQDKVFYRG